MEQICECDYSSLSCFLQLCEKPTSLDDDIFRDINVLDLCYEILRIVEKDSFNPTCSLYACNSLILKYRFF